MYVPYPHQVEAVDSIFNYYDSGKRGNPVVAMPTATGKSLIIAEFCKTVLKMYPKQRIICCTHVKELIEQNAEKIRTQWPNVPLGIYSAGLKQADTHFPLIYCGVQSAVHNIKAFGWRDLLLIDEAHLVSPKDDTNYQKLIAGLRETNPNIKIIGFTATSYRTGHGSIADGPIFTDICFDMTTFTAFNWLIDNGYLCAPVPKKTKTELDVSKVKLGSDGDYDKKQLSQAVDVESVTYAACEEAVEEGFDRASWLAFASGIEHSEHIAAILQSFGIDAQALHSKMPADVATQRIKDFRSGKLRCLVNYGKLTTGFDHPPIDFIIMLRPTTSTVLWVQMLGRGTRPFHLKENCLVLDFARNTVRLGPINDPVIPRKRVKGAQPGIAPIRICPACGVYNHARAVLCFVCGEQFPKIEKLIASAGTDELVRREQEKIISTLEVSKVFHNLYIKPNSKPMLKVVYVCGLIAYPEYICFEHQGMAGKRARMWWRERMGTIATPPTTEEAMKWIGELRIPKRIRVWINKKYPEVLSYEY